MKTIVKQVLLTIAAFLGALILTPMVSTYTGTGDCGDDANSIGSGVGNCGEVTTNKLVFSPVIRTVTCGLWHESGCAPDTFLPTWSDDLMNWMNAVLISLLAGGSYLFVDMVILRRKA